MHRIGRVGRAGREGVAITLSEPRERRQLDNIERLTGRRMEVAKVPSAAQRRSRKLEQLAATLRSTLENAGVESALEGSELDTPELERFVPVVEEMCIRDRCSPSGFGCEGPTDRSMSGSASCPGCSRRLWVSAVPRS